MTIPTPVYGLKKNTDTLIQSFWKKSPSRGGIVEALEMKFATMPGMKSAIFMPTGTLANQIALRKLAGWSAGCVRQPADERTRAYGK